MDRLTRAEFERLVEQNYNNFVGRAIHLCGDYTVAEDAVQNALLLAFEKMGRFEKRSETACDKQFRSWMYKLIAYIISDMYSRVGNARPWQRKWAYTSFIYPDERRMPLMPDVADKLQAKAEYDWSDINYIVDAIESLPKDSLHPHTGRIVPTRYVEIAKMTFLDEMSSEEVGNVLGLAENTIRVRLSRIRKILESKICAGDATW